MLPCFDTQLSMKPGIREKDTAELSQHPPDAPRGSEDGPAVLKSGKEKWEGKRGWE